MHECWHEKIITQKLLRKCGLTYFTLENVLLWLHVISILSASDTEMKTEDKPDNSHSKPDDSHSTADSGLDTSITTDTTTEESKFSEVSPRYV